MEVKFIKASPTENMTLLIETPVAREKQLAVAERLIAYGSVYAEQAGYIEEAENPAAEKRLQMMAGEFCGNASLSLAAWLAQKKNLQIGEKTEITLEVSGAEELVRCEMKREAEHRFLGRVAMPLPQTIEKRAFTLDGERIERPQLFSQALRISSSLRPFGARMPQKRRNTRQGSGRRSCRLCLGFCCLMSRRKA